MVTKPGMAANERKRIFVGSAFEKRSKQKTKQHGQQLPSRSKQISFTQPHLHGFVPFRFLQA
jgi:hypothetical protein